MQRCLVCNRPLKDEESQIRRIGPVCWKRLHIVAEEGRIKKQARLKLRESQIIGQTTIFDMLGDGIDGKRRI